MNASAVTLDASVALAESCNETNCSVADSEFIARMRHFEAVVGVVVPVTFGLIAVLGFFGNLFVIIVVLSNRLMRNTTNILIINLAVADLLFIVMCVPFTAVSYAITVWPFGSVFCKVYQYALNVSAYASVYTLVLMSVDRYLAVVHAISSMAYRNERNAYVVIGILWATIMAMNVPVLYDHEHVSYTSRVASSYGCFFAFGYVLPLTTVCVLYGRLLRRLLYRATPGLSRSAESMRNKRRVTYMVVVVVVMFALCWLPVHVMFLIQYFGPPSQSMTFVSVRIASTCFAYMNSCINPLLYAFLSENFRKSFRRLLCSRYATFEPVKLELNRTATRVPEIGSPSTTERSNGKA
ncbi:hypothetical protein NP493_228g03006 [Ridgeia piscesae]|uniref:G-protein coupled receptors family 1 profile domain-containing protein n=1 Tax=Ridgeia piscesae TaxID=27915 RepID=A0AAD9NZV5_RIDPI|nr:hypothetical protein NP493_228g03006 [Ridgeia piscesae]